MGRVGRSLVWSSVWWWVARSLFLAKIFVKKCANVGFNTFYGTYLKVRKSLVLVVLGHVCVHGSDLKFEFNLIRPFPLVQLKYKGDI